jgi:hypothetical protein
MFEKQSLKDQFKILLIPVIVLSLILVGFIAHHQYEKTLRIQSLEKDIGIIEEVRKIISMVDKERLISLKYISSKDRREKRMISRDLRKQRNINNTRLKALQRKMLQFTESEVKSTPYLKKIDETMVMFHETEKDIRSRIDRADSDSQNVIDYYTALNSNFIDSIIKSSSNIGFSELSRKLLIYSLFLEYRDLHSQKDIYIKTILQSGDRRGKNHIELLKVKAKMDTLKRLSVGIVTDDIFSHYSRISQTPEVSEMTVLFDEVLQNKAVQNRVLQMEELKSILKRYKKRFKELDDHITREISIKVSNITDSHYNEVYSLSLFFLLSISVILVFTYRLYSYIREAIFYGIIKMRSKIVRIVKDVQIVQTKEENEITLLLDLIDNFTINIKRSLNKITRDFNEITILSTNLSQSSEKVVSHLQKQGQYLEEINFKMSIFLDTLQNSRFSFGSLKELLDETSSKLNDLNLDVIYISYETLNLKDQSQQIVDNGVKCRENNNLILKTLKEQSSLSEDGKKITVDIEVANRFQAVVEENNSTLDNQVALLTENIDKLHKLSQVAISIKNDAEKNHNNVGELVAVISALSNETKVVSSEIQQTMEENQEFTESSKEMIQNSEYVYSDVTMLNKYVINLNMEFNKFRI